MLSRFDTTVEVLRGDPEYYDGSIPGYFLSAGGGIGEISTLSYLIYDHGRTPLSPGTFNLLL